MPEDERGVKAATQLHTSRCPGTGWNTRARGRPVWQSDESGELNHW